MSRTTIPFTISSLRSPVPGGSSWRDFAACRTLDQAIFFPDAGDAEAVEQAKRICGECPVMDECLSYAVGTNQTEGLWGGTTPSERRRLRQRWLKELREAG